MALQNITINQANAAYLNSPTTATISVTTPWEIVGGKSSTYSQARMTWTNASSLQTGVQFYFTPSDTTYYTTSEYVLYIAKTNSFDFNNPATTGVKLDLDYENVLEIYKTNTGRINVYLIDPSAFINAIDAAYAAGTFGSNFPKLCIVPLTDTTSYTYTENLTNCTSNYTDTTITSGEHTITLTANSGYEFTETPTVSGGTISATISTDKSTCTCTVNVTADFTITATASEIVVTEYTITQNLTNCTSDYTNTTITEGSQVIYLTANDNHIFNNNPTITGSTATIEKTTNKKTIICTINVTGNLIINATADLITYSYTQNLTNCSSDYTDNTITIGENTITLTANDGYEFTDTPTVTGGTISATISADKLTCTCAVNVTADFTITATATKVTKEYTYTQTLTNCSSDYTGSTITEGEHTVTLTANDGYEFTDTPTVTGGTISATISTDKLTCTCAVNVTADFTITATASEIVIGQYSFTQTLTNCSSNYTDSTITAEEHTITLTADTNYWFSSTNFITVTNSGSPTITVATNKLTATVTFTPKSDCVLTAKAFQYIYSYSEQLTHCYSNYTSSTIQDGVYDITFTADDGYEFTNANVLLYTTGGHSYTYTLTGTQATATLTISGDTVVYLTATKSVVSLSPLVSLFAPTDNEISQLASIRFFDDDSNLVDRGQYIVEYYVLPFEIPDSMQADKRDIYLGTYDTTVQSVEIDGYMLNVDLGSINVPAIYNNVYDYKDTNATLFLPYASEIEIPIEMIISQTISINYLINLYSGDCIIIIKSTLTNETILTQRANVAIRVPYTQLNDSAKTNLNVPLINDILTPYIQITRNIPYDVTTQWGKPCIESGLVSDFNGYIETEFIDLQTTATNAEKDEIIALMQKGVFIV